MSANVDQYDERWYGTYEAHFCTALKAWFVAVVIIIFYNEVTFLKQKAFNLKKYWSESVIALYFACYFAILVSLSEFNFWHILFEHISCMETLIGYIWWPSWEWNNESKVDHVWRWFLWWLPLEIMASVMVWRYKGFDVDMEMASVMVWRYMVSVLTWRWLQRWLESHMIAILMEFWCYFDDAADNLFQVWS